MDKVRRTDGDALSDNTDASVPAGRTKVSGSRTCPEVAARFGRVRTITSDCLLLRPWHDDDADFLLDPIPLT